GEPASLELQTADLPLPGGDLPGIDDILLALRGPVLEPQRHAWEEEGDGPGEEEEQQSSQAQPASEAALPRHLPLRRSRRSPLLQSVHDLAEVREAVRRRALEAAQDDGLPDRI